ncbi:MAG: glycoside hydrolase domain-containing protein [Planctomycetota bacterium]
MKETLRIALGILLLVAGVSSAEQVNLPNASFESGKDKPDGWSLEGGKGKWEDGGRTGEKCISVTGTGEDSGYWRCDAMPLKPNAVYRVRFFTKSDAPGGCIITCSSFVNRDFSAGKDWEEKSFIFRTPSEIKDGFIRFGQWHKRGTVWFDDIEFTEVAPIHLMRDGVTLGVGESIAKGAYRFNAPMGKESSNYSRCLDGHTCGFNSNRWTFGNGATITYRHAVDSFAQTSGKAAVNMSYHQSGECIIEVRKDGGPWREIARLGKDNGQEAQLPADLFPAKAVDVRLRSTGGFQVTNYAYEATLDGRPPEFRGDTWFLQTVKDSKDIAVTVRSLGALCPGGENVVNLLLTEPKGRSGEVDLLLRMTPEQGAEIKRNASVAFAVNTTLQIPYALESAGKYDLTLSARDHRSGLLLFETACSFLVPPLYAADFGYALDGTDACEVWWCEPAHKISRERPAPTIRRAMEAAAAKGEYEPIQLVVRPNRDLSNVKIGVGEFRNKDKIIPAKNIQVALVEYVPVKVPTDGLGCVGDWPDPLPPYEKPVDMKAGKNQPVWITFNVPHDAAPGDYQGNIEIVPGNAPPISVPLTLHVYDFSIPKDWHLQVGMNLSKGALKRYHNLETNEEVEQVFHLYNQNMAEHRISNFNIMAYYAPVVSFDGANWQGGEKTTAEKLAGGKSLLVVDDDAQRVVTVSSLQYFPVMKGEKYEFSWAAKTAKGHPYLVTLQQYDADRRWISGNNIDLRCEGTGEWKKETCAVDERINPNARYMTINLRPALWTETGEHKGQAYFDEIVFRKLPDGANMVIDPGFEGGVDDLKMKIDFTRFDEAGKKFLDELGFNVFRVPLFGFGGGTFHSSRAGRILNYDQGTPEYMKLFSQYCKTLVDHMKEKGWYDKHCIYWFDEPDPKDYAFVVEGMKCLKQADPRLKRMLTEQPEPELLGHVDIWLPVLSSYSREALWPRQEKGEVLWWYICCGPHTPYPNNFIDHPGIEPRIWFWMTWRERVTGNHIWHVNYWNGPLVYPAPDIQNPWDDPMSYVSGYDKPVGYVGYWGNGDGRSVYPPNRDPKNDKRKYLCGPVNSIRWELMREGIEDYEYFHLLREKIAALEKTGKQPTLVEEATALLDIPSDLIEDLTHYTKDPTKLEAHRARLARMIERIEKAM